MIQHVGERAMAADLAPVFVAKDDRSIADVIEQAGIDRRGRRSDGDHIRGRGSRSRDGLREGGAGGCEQRGRRGEQISLRDHDRLP